MVRIKEGFRGERLVFLPEQLLDEYSRDPLIGNLYIRKIGYFPRVKYHYVRKEHGCDYMMLVYCTEGKGWYRIGGHTYEICCDEFVIIPCDTPYAFGANAEDPWTIYWLHFKGSQCRLFQPSTLAPQSIRPGDHSRLQDRLHLFEEIYQAFSLAYIKEYMRYASLCLYSFLGSFVCLEQYRSVFFRNAEKKSFASKVIHYMQENVQHQLTLGQLAAYFKYSPSHFSMLFQHETGVSPISYFLRLKIQKACQYIELTDLKLSEISTLLGFEELAYFSRLFSKVMGVSPSEYRKKEIGHTDRR